jgi:hypothetical protein
MANYVYEQKDFQIFDGIPRPLLTDTLKETH